LRKLRKDDQIIIIKIVHSLSFKFMLIGLVNVLLMLAIYLSFHPFVIAGLVLFVFVLGLMV